MNGEICPSRLPSTDIPQYTNKKKEAVTERVIHWKSPKEPLQ
jgi:hypothetical protein